MRLNELVDRIVRRNPRIPLHAEVWVRVVTNEKNSDGSWRCIEYPLDGRGGFMTGWEDGHVTLLALGSQAKPDSPPEPLAFVRRNVDHDLEIWETHPGNVDPADGWRPVYLNKH